MHTGALLEKAVLAPAFVVAALWFLYANTAARETIDPFLSDILAR